MDAQQWRSEIYVGNQKNTRAVSSILKFMLMSHMDAQEWRSEIYVGNQKIQERFPVF